MGSNLYNSDDENGFFANGAATAAFAYAFSESASSSAKLEAGNNVELFDEGLEFSFEEKLKLRAALKTQADELDQLISAGKFNNKEALGRLVKAAKSYNVSNVRKLSLSNKVYGSSAKPPRAYHTFEEVNGAHVSRIYLSKSTFNEIMSGSSGQYTFLHEVAHSLNFNHNFDNRSFKFQQILCGNTC